MIIVSFIEHRYFAIVIKVDPILNETRESKSIDSFSSLENLTETGLFSRLYWILNGFLCLLA